MGETTAQDESDTLAHVEFLVEPFTPGTPGPHVQAALAAFAGQGVAVDLGPFASTASGSPEELANSIRDMIVDSMNAGASSVRCQVGAPGQTLGVPTLHDALDGMIRMAEREVGSNAGEWTREEKQRAVRMLDDRGAFLLRGAVDDIAEVMGVSRITIYNYLGATEDDTK